ncbi:hypothetical protein LTR36_006585 [Oleoguttula mirabilis]|uniref:Uncharacterized protein n=1 Tax=Oleoguttula mirabilis TaxID=1507867 RepID=A0AAV9JBF7_9PEZI|nr:hypothetical protein LTR36_006585 [Oleoguttula mirabilis]
MSSTPPKQASVRKGPELDIPRRDNIGSDDVLDSDAQLDIEHGAKSTPADMTSRPCVSSTPLPVPPQHIESDESDDEFPEDPLAEYTPSRKPRQTWQSSLDHEKEPGVPSAMSEEDLLDVRETVGDYETAEPETSIGAQTSLGSETAVDNELSQPATVGSAVAQAPGPKQEPPEMHEMPAQQEGLAGRDAIARDDEVVVTDGSFGGGAMVPMDSACEKQLMIDEAEPGQEALLEHIPAKEKRQRRLQVERTGTPAPIQLAPRQPTPDNGSAPVSRRKYKRGRHAIQDTGAALGLSRNATATATATAPATEEKLPPILRIPVETLTAIMEHAYPEMPSSLTKKDARTGSTGCSQPTAMKAHRDLRAILVKQFFEQQFEERLNLAYEEPKPSNIEYGMVYTSVRRIHDTDADEQDEPNWPYGTDDKPLKLSIAICNVATATLWSLSRWVAFFCEKDLAVGRRVKVTYSYEKAAGDSKLSCFIEQEVPALFERLEMLGRELYRKGISGKEPIKEATWNWFKAVMKDKEFVGMQASEAVGILAKVNEKVFAAATYNDAMKVGKKRKRHG